MRCITVWLEIDPGDGGAEVMIDEHFIAPRLSREAKQEQKNKTGGLRCWWAVRRAKKKLVCVAIDPHVAGVAGNMSEMGGQSDSRVRVTLSECSGSPIRSSINLQNNAWSKESCAVPSQPARNHDKQSKIWAEPGAML